MRGPWGEIWGFLGIGVPLGAVWGCAGWCFQAPRWLGPRFFPPQVFQVPLPPLPEGGHRFYPPTLISGAALTSCCLRELVGDPGGTLRGAFWGPLDVP